MIALVGLVAGAVTSALLWRLLRRELTASAVLRRENYRGHELPVAGGIVLVLAAVVVAAATLAWERYGGISADEATRGLVLLGGSVLGFGFIGLVDDLVGSASTKGVRGHVGALRHGELTTGLVKLVWGLLLGFIAVPGSLGDAVRGGVLIAATANLGNLFDRAPGRVIKMSMVGAVVLVATGLSGWVLYGPLVIVGAGVGLLVADLREEVMLGDTGANVLGAAIGHGLVLSLAATGEWIALVVVVGLNLLSERVSFSRVIDRMAPLRWLDRLGTVPERRGRSA